MDAMARILKTEAISRLGDHDPSLFAEDRDGQATVLDRLGWTHLAGEAASHLLLVEDLAAALTDDGITDIVLLGMGGSSLAPLVMSAVLEPAEGAPGLHVLDTTAPSEAKRLMEVLAPLTTAFIVASKSGTTIEPMSLYAIFREWMDGELGREAAGTHFIVITDPGTPLEAASREEVMRVVVAAPPDVGGRFSALSVFGLVPAALAGLDVQRMVGYAAEMEAACHVSDPSNPGALLAAWMMNAFEAGRDKLTFVASPRYRALGLWVEQLVAESTGKNGTGILPVLEDGSVPPSAYDADRALVIVREQADGAEAEHSRLAEEAGVPVLELIVAEPAALGAEFVRWEFAVALVGFLMGVNPFDEPNVSEAKAATAGVLEGSVSPPSPAAVLSDVRATPAGALAGMPAPTTLVEAFAPLIDTLHAGTYLAILAYLPDSDELLDPLRAAAAAISQRYGVAVCVELGPRYLHSTGQLHKGGPSIGSFLLLTTRDQADLAVPGKPFSLGRLFRAQAEGDLVTLAAHGRPVLLLDLPDESADAVNVVARALSATAR